MTDQYSAFQKFREIFSGTILTDESSLLMYSTDASAYKEKPAAVFIPENDEDLKQIVAFAAESKQAIIPRTAGTSLAGQVVGNGIIVDLSRHFRSVLEFNKEEKWISVQPGVVLDELNMMLEPFGLFFGPETSTSNRCMVGGMVGNNSCGSHSLIYGSTRDHTLSIKAILSNGEEVEFHDLNRMEFEKKLQLQSLEGEIYRHIHRVFSDKDILKEIEDQFPEKELHRRNTGYALDLLSDCSLYSANDKPFNFSKLIAGSEGTLCLITAIKLNLVPLPPPENGLLCVHCNSLDEAFSGNIIALKHKPVAVELMDNIILEQTKSNITQSKNRFFLNGEPAAVLLVEIAENTRAEVNSKCDAIEAELIKNGYGYYFSRVYGNDIKKVWALRKAGLGVLSNIPGDAKPVAVIEDTAVSPSVLPSYMSDFRKLLDQLGLACVYYAHIGTGELHLRPVLNLKDPSDTERFRTIALETAKLVKKYRGSLSGEHGDGRLRGEFIPLMMGEKIYSVFKEIKQVWDPDGIFNPGKITGTPPMNTFLRYETGKKVEEPKTFFDFSKTQGLIRAVEQCNGSADCRKTASMGGTMCPSFQATLDEKNTTRARANLLREFLTNSSGANRFDHKELYDVLDLCLSCKGCKSECPSNIDMARFKAEFLQHYYDTHGISLRTRLIANITKLNEIGSIFPAFYNFFLKNRITSRLIKRVTGFSTERSMPLIYRQTLRSWAKVKANTDGQYKHKVYLFADEFSNYNDVEIGMKAIRALNKLGYEVKIPAHSESGRTYLSKGLLRKAKKLANANILALKDVVNQNTPIVGIEPSAILSFRDEYPDLCSRKLKNAAEELAKNALMFDEFISLEIKAGRISKDKFTTEGAQIKLHGHCMQKAVAGTASTKEMLSFPENYTVEEIKSGCCGMAGSFGFEKEHYDLSLKIGELILFPAVRSAAVGELIAAPGTSCRQQIHDGTGKTVLHPIEIFYSAIK